MDTRTMVPAPNAVFRHGVASGDPLPSAVVLWTRTTSAMLVEWEMSKSADFMLIEAGGMVSTDAETDFTVKIDVHNLSPGTTYYYRFRAGRYLSAMGRTRTAPRDATRIRLAVCACASYADGFFHAYRRLASHPDIDAVLHLGDYIYEYGHGFRAFPLGSVRRYELESELTTLADYRARYANYRADPALQEAHRQHPFITVWDDHETVNDASREGPESIEPAQWRMRRDAAVKANREWLPIRDQMHGNIYRAFDFGNLAHIVMLDTRLTGRDRQGEGDDVSRELLGTEQLAFVERALIQAQSARWSIIGQQVLMMQLPGRPNPDTWDGYPGARNRFLEMLKRTGPLGRTVVLTGDLHHAAAGTVSLVGERVVPEFMTSGVTSPNFDATSRESGDAYGARMKSLHPHIGFWDAWHRGYLLVDITRDAVNTSWMFMDSVTLPDLQPEFVGASWKTRFGETTIERGDAPVDASDAPMLAP